MHYPLALLLLLIVGVNALSNLEITRSCGRRAGDTFGTAREQCRSFKRCCAEKCREDGRAVVMDTCEGTFFDTAEKDCVCGRPHSGRSSSRRRWGSDSDFTDDCSREGDEMDGSVNTKCETFKRCCRERCRQRGTSVREEECDGFMFSLAEKKCRCRGRGGNREPDWNDGRGGSSSRSGSSSRADNQRIETDCIREGDDVDGGVSDKCSAFKRCCSRECRSAGLRDMVNRCDGFLYYTAQKQCQCEGSTSHSGDRSPDNGGSSRRGGSSRGSDASAQCREKARLSPYDASAKCRDFKTCCIDVCLRRGGVTDQNTCEPTYLQGARCICDISQGGSDRDDRYDGGSSRGGSSRGGGSRGGGLLSETRTCNRVYETTLGTRDAKCRAFSRCCTNECRAHRMGVRREECSTEGFATDSDRECTCGGSTSSGAGSRTRYQGGLREISRRCRREAERDGSSGWRCDRFRTCCRRRCEDKDMRFRDSRCDRYSFDDASCECSQF